MEPVTALTENDLIFEIPDNICKMLGIDHFGPSVKRYMVKEDGSLWLPWGFLLEGVAWDGIFRDAAYLINDSDTEYQDQYWEMVRTLIKYHENKFDPSIKRVEA